MEKVRSWNRSVRYLSQASSFPTSVFSAISLMDLMFTAKDLIGLYYKTAENLFLLVVFYLIILLPVSLLGSWLERRLRYAGFGS